MQKVVQKVVVAAIIIQDQKILLLQRKDDEESFAGYWELPGGKKDDLELVSDALIREVEEETNLAVAESYPFNVFNYTLEKGDHLRDTTQINHIVTVSEGAAEIGEDHQDLKWATIDYIESLKISDETRHALELAFEELELDYPVDIEEEKDLPEA